MEDHGPYIVRAMRTMVPAESYCLGLNQDGVCRFAVYATRSLPEIELRKMARKHAESNPGHVVQVNITDSTFYSATD